MSDYKTYIIMAITIFVLIILAITYTIIKRAKSRKGSAKPIKPSNKGAGTLEGINYHYRNIGGTQHSPPSFEITLESDSPAILKIKKESRVDKFFKRLGIAAEISTHDSTFDNRFYIDTDDNEFASFVVRKSTVRQAIATIFDIGFTSLNQTKKYFKASWIPYRNKYSIEKQQVEKIVREMVRIIKEVKSAPTSTMSATPTGWKLKRLIIFALPILMGLWGIFSIIAGFKSYLPLEGWPLVLGSFKYSIPLFIFFSWLSLNLLKGRSSSHTEWLAVFFISLIAIPLGFAGGKVFLNGYLDKSPSTSHKVSTIRKYYTQSKNSKSYYVVVQTWRDREGISTEKLGISYRKYRQIIPEITRIKVVTKPGKYNYEWIERVDLIN